MSALDHQALAAAAKAQGIDIDTIKKLVNPFVWQWCHEHEDMKVLSIKWAFISKTVRVRDCEWLVAQLVGPENPLAQPV